MRIAHFNTALHGGAAIAAKRIHESLLTNGIDSKFYFSRGTPPNATYSKKFLGSKYDLLNPKNLFSIINRKLKINKHIKGKPEGFTLFSNATRYYQTPIANYLRDLDIIHLHWIADYIDYPSFFESIPTNVPIVWTLHDMNAFTGGCHYSWDCTNYKNHCGNCPQLNNPSNHDISCDNFDIKLKALKNCNLHIVADSDWLRSEAEKSNIFQNIKSIRTIHYGIDTSKFSPRNKLESRSQLGIDKSKIVITFGADTARSKRKGLHLLLKAVESIKEKSRLLLVIFGLRQDIKLNSHVEIKNLGRINSEDYLATIYSASDIFAIPSIHEAFGQTALESIACGTPVAGFKIGGIPEIVIDNTTGILSNPYDTTQLAQSIEKLINNEIYRNSLSEKCVKYARNNFSYEIQAKKYLDLYNQIVLDN